MSVNKYTLNNTITGSTGYTINVSMESNSETVGQKETVDKSFVNDEVKKSINVIFDYEKVKLLPKSDSESINVIDYTPKLLSKGIEINGVEKAEILTLDMTAIKTVNEHNLNIGDKVVILNPLTDIFNKEFVIIRLGLDDGSLEKKSFVINVNPSSTLLAFNFTDNLSLCKKVFKFWGEIGFTDDDLKIRKNNFIKSFLRLDFYDSDIVSNQNLISFITLFPKFKYPLGVGEEFPKANEYSLTFSLVNPMYNNKYTSEGFSLYHFKDEILPHPLPPKYLYMRATFNNAKTGKANGLMSSVNYNLSIDNLIKSTADDSSEKNNLFTRYKLIRTNEGYFYEIDTEYSDNVSYNSSIPSYTITLHEISSK